jgi:hypothetical protein
MFKPFLTTCQKCLIYLVQSPAAGGGATTARTPAPDRAAGPRPAEGTGVTHRFSLMLLPRSPSFGQNIFLVLSVTKCLINQRHKYRDSLWEIAFVSSSHIGQTFCYWRLSTGRLLIKVGHLPPLFNNVCPYCYWTCIMQFSLLIFYPKIIPNFHQSITWQVPRSKFSFIYTASSHQRKCDQRYF